MGRAELRGRVGVGHPDRPSARAARGRGDAGHRVLEGHAVLGRAGPGASRREQRDRASGRARVGLGPRHVVGAHDRAEALAQPARRQDALDLRRAARPTRSRAAARGPARAPARARRGRTGCRRSSSSKTPDLRCGHRPHAARRRTACRAAPAPGGSRSGRRRPRSSRSTRRSSIVIPSGRRQSRRARKCRGSLSTSTPSKSKTTASQAHTNRPRP